MIKTAATVDIDVFREGVIENMTDLVAKSENLAYAMVNRARIFQFVSNNFHEILDVPAEFKLEGVKIDDVLSEVGLQDAQKDVSFSPSDIPQNIENNFATGEAHRQSLLITTIKGRKVRLNSWYTGEDELIITVRDISESRRHLNLLEMAMDCANAGFWSLDFSTGQFEYSDTVLKRLTPAEVEKIQKHGLWAIIHREDVAEMTKTWQAILNGEAPFELTYRVVTEKDGVMWQRSVGQIERGSDGKFVGATAFVRDVTPEVKKHKDLLTAKEASKTKSEFLARMSHEIRTPLNAIIGMSDSLKDETLSDDVMDVVNDIEQAAEGLHHLLSRTLDHAKLMSNKMQVDLHKASIKSVIEDCAKLWRPQSMAKKVALNIHYGQDLPKTMLLDSFRVQQCLNNLLSNAVKFTEKGRIDVIVKCVNLKDREHLIIAVQDTGIGMNVAVKDSIFNAFSQADGTISRRYGGTGLGMNITKQLTELMGGEIRVKSQPDIGSTFALFLPVLSNADELKALRGDAEITQTPSTLDTPPPIAMTANMSPQDSDEKKPFEGLSVLCVEDNMVNQKVVKRLIGKRVSNLTFANNGREALDVLSAMHVDVVLMDIHMPVMDGIETTLEIRGSDEPWANVIIIALTADPDYQQQRICINIGMDDTIAKPVRREDILNAFDRVIGGINRDFAQKIRLKA